MPRKTVVTVIGIRPDIIRLAALIKRLDEDTDINHILVSSGQHYDNNLHDSFFEELNVRKPDKNLHVGEPGLSHAGQLSRLIKDFPDYLETLPNKPDIILFLGDSNSVMVAPVLKKCGYKIGHIEAGMRCGRDIFEEINRKVIDSIADVHFCYHDENRYNLFNENHSAKFIFDVGNTIVEPVNTYFNKELSGKKENKHILVDLHRNELIENPEQLKRVIEFCNWIGRRYILPIYMLNFPRTTETLFRNNIALKDILLMPLQRYQDYLNLVYHSKFIISDSGTAQDECPLLQTPVIVPRGETERWPSVSEDCSFLLMDRFLEKEHREMAAKWVDSGLKMGTEWLGKGETSKEIADILKHIL